MPLLAGISWKVNLAPQLNPEIVNKSGLIDRIDINLDNKNLHSLYDPYVGGMTPQLTNVLKKIKEIGRDVKQDFETEGVTELYDMVFSLAEGVEAESKKHDVDIKRLESWIKNMR